MQVIEIARLAKQMKTWSTSVLADLGAVSNIICQSHLQPLRVSSAGTGGLEKVGVALLTMVVLGAPRHGVSGG